MEERTGYISHITYRNEENGYTVLDFVSQGEEFTCVGIFPSAEEGMCMVLQGEEGVHKSYGEQFQVSEAKEAAPRDAASMERYLGSGAIHGIGLALAARIVRHFGEDTFRIVEEEPERLAEVKGISPKKAMEISSQMEEKRDQRQAMLFLQQYGIGMSLGVKLYHAYGQDMYRILKENPYQLAEDMEGIGFRIADEIAKKVGIKADSDFRIKCGIIYCLQQAAGAGHTCLPIDLLSDKTAQILELTKQEVEQQYMNMAMEKKLILKKEEEITWVYSPSFYYMEQNSAAMLQRLNQTFDINEKKFNDVLDKIQKEDKIELDTAQAEAIRSSLTHGLLIITGGPGTGKTTTINSIIRLLEMENMEMLLAAPTGRAAKRMSEMTGYEAKTIHRLLEQSGGPEGGGFERNEENPLEADTIIIDEMSMVDINLMYSLLKAVVPGTRLILVGDANQLPSVGPGCVLRDMIQSGFCKVVELTKIFRQAKTSNIVVNAHKINKGEEVVIDNNNKDFFFLKRYDGDVIIQVMLVLILKKLPAYVKTRPQEIQVLTPTRKGILGVERLNRILQQHLNPPDSRKMEKKQGDLIFREGDKVMQIKNNYQLEWQIESVHGLVIDRGMGVFNGDTGYILEINQFTETMTVNFEDDRRVTYSFKQLEELEHAYAVTIHKSQGSEYPAVVIPLLPGPRLLMNRNLLYTAVTRARSCVTIVGDEQTFYQMIQNTSQQKRYSGLKRRLEEESL